MNLKMLVVGLVVACCTLTVAARTGSAQTPTAFSCSGNEPFWSLTIDDDRAQFSRPMAETVETTDLGGLLTTVDYLPQPVVVWRGRGQEMDADVVAFIFEQECNDTMSGRQFSHSARLSLPDGTVVVGCCNVEKKHAAHDPRSTASPPLE